MTLTLDRKDAKERIQNILDGSDYQEAMAIPEVELPESLKEFILLVLDSFEELAITSPILYWMTIAGLILITVVLIIHSVLGIAQLRKGKATLADMPHQSSPQDIIGDLTAAADSAEADGRWMDALRGRFGIFILLYRRHHPGVFPLGATNREVAQALRQEPMLGAPIRRVQMALDAGWYGGQRLSQDTYQGLRADLEALHRGI